METVLSGPYEQVREEQWADCDFATIGEIEDKEDENNSVQ